MRAIPLVLAASLLLAGFSAQAEVSEKEFDDLKKALDKQDWRAVTAG